MTSNCSTIVLIEQSQIYSFDANTSPKTYWLVLPTLPSQNCVLYPPFPRKVIRFIYSSEEKCLTYLPFSKHCLYYLPVHTIYYITQLKYTYIVFRITNPII